MNLGETPCAPITPAARAKSPLSTSQQELAAKYLPMARALSRPFKDRFPDSWEEFDSAACLALVEAARAFDPDRDVKFSTFARRRIWGGLCDARRQRCTTADASRARRPRPRLPSFG